MLVIQEPERTSGFAGYPYDPFVDVRARQPMRPAYDQWAPAWSITDQWERQLFAATRTMKVTNAASCCLMNPHVGLHP